MNTSSNTRPVAVAVADLQAGAVYSMRGPRLSYRKTAGPFRGTPVPSGGPYCAQRPLIRSAFSEFGLSQVYSIQGLIATS